MGPVPYGGISRTLVNFPVLADVWRRLSVNVLRIGIRQRDVGHVNSPARWFLEQLEDPRAHGVARKTHQFRCIGERLLGLGSAIHDRAADQESQNWPCRLLAPEVKGFVSNAHQRLRCSPS